METGLYVVATPIGNLRDITLRAIDVLRDVDIIACEDTRHVRRLLDEHGIRTPCIALHQHNEATEVERVIGLLRDGKAVALVSDAGTPAVSDPGSRLVQSVHAQGLRVVPVPGACAAIAALSVAGVVERGFLFLGFLPTKEAARRAELARVASIPWAVVFYEAPHRVVECAADLLATFGPDRQVVIARELTKMFEQVARLRLADLATWFDQDANHCRGEFVFVVMPGDENSPGETTALSVLQCLLAELPVKQAVKLAAGITGCARNDLYAMALRMKGDG